MQPIAGCCAFRLVRGYARGEAGTALPLDFGLIHVPRSLPVRPPTMLPCLTLALGC